MSEKFGLDSPLVPQEASQAWFSNCTKSGRPVSVHASETKVWYAEWNSVPTYVLPCVNASCSVHEGYGGYGMQLIYNKVIMPTDSSIVTV